MKIGIITYWFNRGQATVGRFLRDSLDSLGHETFIFARPDASAGLVSKEDVWQQENIYIGKGYQPEPNEYVSWAERNDLEIVFLFQNYAFEEIERLKKSGIKTVGCFMRESLKQDHVEKVNKSYTAIYAANISDSSRMKKMGVKNIHNLTWMVHPSQLGDPKPLPEIPTFFYPGGYSSQRKAYKEVTEGFKSLKVPARLVVKTIKPPRQKIAAKNIQIINKEMSTQEYIALLKTVDIMIGVARWEGLGLHLYESIGLGIPILGTNTPPINEVVHHHKTGALVECLGKGKAISGVRACGHSPKEIALEMQYMINHHQELQKNQLKLRNEMSWTRFESQLSQILSQV